MTFDRSEPMPEVGEAVRGSSPPPADPARPAPGATPAAGSTGGVQDVVRPRDDAGAHAAVPEPGVPGRPAPTRRRRVGRVVGAAVAALAVGALGLGVLGAQTTTSTQTAAATPRLYVTSSGADVHVEAGGGTQIVTETRTGPGRSCEVRPSSTASATFLRVTCDGSALFSPDVTIRVPGSTQMTVDAGNGDVDASGTLSSLDVRTDEDIELNGYAGDARLRAGGDVDGDVSGARRLSVTAGDDVDLQVRQAPDTSTRVDAGADVDLTMPAGSYRTHVDTSGDVENELGHASGGAFVDVTSRGGGDVDLHID